jgi:hypothetical protein
MIASLFFRAIDIFALTGNFDPVYHHFSFGEARTMGIAVSSKPPLASQSGTTLNESIRRSGCVVQRFAATLREMYPAERRPLIEPLIALIERVVDRDQESISASSAPATGDPQPLPKHDCPQLDHDTPCRVPESIERILLDERKASKTAS